MSGRVTEHLALEIASREDIEQMIFFVRGQRVMIDHDLALLYGVETKHLNRQARRNAERFPEEFMFRLTREERDELVTNCHRFRTLKHSYSLPHVFTENGVAMLASVLKSKRAVKISIHIIKTFVKLRRWVAASKDLARKLDELEARVGEHDEEIQLIFQALRELVNAREPKKNSKRRIGFRAD